MGQLGRVMVMLIVTSVAAHHGYSQSAPESDAVGPRNMRGPATPAQPQTGPPATPAQPQTGPPATPAQLQTRSPTAEDDRGSAVARVLSRQREAMLYWVLVSGAAGLAAIAVLSLLTVLVHKSCRRSRAVDIRHKQLTARQAGGARKHKVGHQTAVAGGHQTVVAEGHQTAVAGTGTSYCNMNFTPAPPTARLADSMVSWGSEFEPGGDLTEHIYSNDYKKPPRDDGKKDMSKPANQDIYVNGCAL